MAEKRIQYRKTATGKEKQLIASAADIVEITNPEACAKLGGKTNVEDALVLIADAAAEGGVQSVNGEKGHITLDKSWVGLDQLDNVKQIAASEKGVANGVAPLGEDKLVPSQFLPSYVDDVVDVAIKTKDENGNPIKFVYESGTEVKPETGKIYVHSLPGNFGIAPTNKTYRYSGSVYVEISKSLALGETSETAYPGDLGAQNTKDVTQLKQDVDDLRTGLVQVVNGTTKVGAANQADKLSTSKIISFEGGDVVSSGTAISFDGSNNVTGTLTLTTVFDSDKTFSVTKFDKKGRAISGGQLIEWGDSDDKDPSTNLVNGGIFFELVGETND